MKPIHLLLAPVVLLSVPAFAQSEPLHLPPMEVTDSSLEMGAQFNPFVNSFTKRVKYVNVSHVKEGTVAARAGLKAGDRVVEIDGVRLTDYKISEVPSIHIPSVNGQAKVPLVVRRKGVSEPLTITLVFSNFSGSVDWVLSDATPQKRMLKTDDWHLDKASKPAPATK